MKYVSLLLLVLVLEACNNDKSDTVSNEPTSYNRYVGKIEVDHCEYVVYTLYGNGVAMVHAGNCHNPIHHLYPDTPNITMGYGSVIAADTIIAYKKFVYRPK